MRGFAPCLACSSILLASGVAAADDTVPPDRIIQDGRERSAVYPLTVHAAVGLDPSGAAGRWGLAIARHPKNAWGIGYGVGAGFIALSPSNPNDPQALRPTSGGWASPFLRFGRFGWKRDEAEGVEVSGFAGADLVPTMDVLGDGTVRASIGVRPHFLLAVYRFAFGLGMQVDDTLVASGPRGARGIGVSGVIQIGMTF